MIKYKTMEKFKNYADEIANQNGFIISKYNEDQSVDVIGDLCLDSDNLSEMPIKFNKVTGHFYCERNNITSYQLKYCPRYVDGDFICYANYLTSLKNGPKYVGGIFDCSNNSLTSLEGCHEFIGGTFDCSNNNLTSLKGCPRHIEGDFVCSNNMLKSLKHAPEIIRGKWIIDDEYKSYPEYQKYLLVKKIEAL